MEGKILKDKLTIHQLSSKLLFACEGGAKETIRGRRRRTRAYVFSIFLNAKT